MSDDERLRRWRLILGGERGRRRRLRARAALTWRWTRPGRAVRLPSARRAGQLGAERGALAGRHPQLLSRLGGAGDAAGRPGAAQPAPDAAGARDARGGRAGRAPGGRPALAAERDARPRRARRRGRWCAGWWRSWSAGWPNPLRQAVLGSLNRAARNRRPAPQRDRLAPHDPRQPASTTSPSYRTIIPETRIGYGRKRSALRDIILCVDQSGSMAASVVYAGIFGAVLASLPAVQHAHGRLRHRGGRPDRASCTTRSSCCSARSSAAAPTSTGAGLLPGAGPPAAGDDPGADQRPVRGRQRATRCSSARAALPARACRYRAAGAERRRRAQLRPRAWRPRWPRSGVPAFACTPDLFPDLMAAAINRQDIGQWAAPAEIVTAG